MDCRLGTNEDFAAVCDTLHRAGIRVVIDGVFNHVGRGFWAFRDVQEKKWDSPYKDWFHINFDGESNYGDGFWYEGWEGHYELVKLNLRNPAVVDYLLSCVQFWREAFGIDGLRLDVAYCLDREFLTRLRAFTDSLDPEFFLVGETLHGDYNQWVNDRMLHSCTNYECYKGLWSSLNSMNLFEIVHSLKRQFGPEPWTLYKGKHLLCFVDNHDVTRAASILQNPRHLPLLYGLMFGMPGIPCVYYGSEWGEEAVKIPGTDDNLRPCFDAPKWNGLTDTIAAMAPDRVVYVSCDPGTLARDVKRFAQRGYAAKRAVAVDMFPRTVHVETVCLLSKLNAKQHIEVDIHMDELDLTDAEKKATYSEIKEYVLEHTGLKVSSLYIAQVKQKCGIIERENYNKPKSDDAKQPQCPPDKEKAIKEALKHFGMI